VTGLDGHEIPRAPDLAIFETWVVMSELRSPVVMTPKESYIGKKSLVSGHAFSRAEKHEIRAGL